jgi:hypothetical protein
MAWMSLPAGTADGLFERFPCDAVYGMHNMPGIPVGNFALRKGPLMAGSGRWVVTFRGTGGHGGNSAHLSTDVTVALAFFIQALQAIISHNVAATETAVICVGHITGGSPEALNAMPSEMVIGGTMRAFNPHGDESDGPVHGLHTPNYNFKSGQTHSPYPSSQQLRGNDATGCRPRIHAQAGKPLHQEVRVSSRLKGLLRHPGQPLSEYLSGRVGPASLRNIGSLYGQVEVVEGQYRSGLQPGVPGLFQPVAPQSWHRGDVKQGVPCQACDRLQRIPFQDSRAANGKPALGYHRIGVVAVECVRSTADHHIVVFR